MDESLVPAPLQSLLHAHIDSIDQLEILLWLYRHSNESWSASSVASALHLPTGVTEEALQVLGKGGFLGVTVAAEGLLFFYRPASTELEELMGRLGEVYPQQRIAIMKLLTAGAISRLKARALHTFVSASPSRNAKQ
jgi:hypothetical protein